MESTNITPYTIPSIGYSKELDILTIKPLNSPGFRENLVSTSTNIDTYTKANDAESGKANISSLPKDLKANTHETSIEPNKSKDKPGNTNVKPISIGQRKPKQNQMNICLNEPSSKSFYIIYVSLFVIVILFAIFAYIIAEQEKKMTSLLNEKFDDAALNVTGILDEKLEKDVENMASLNEILHKKLDDFVKNIKLNLSQESFERQTHINQEAQERKTQINQETQERKNQINQETQARQNQINQVTQERKNQINQETQERKDQINQEAETRKIEDDALNGRVQNAQNTADNANNRISNAESRINSQQSQLDKAVETSGWYKATDNRYYKHFSRPVNYDQATDLCQDMGATLAASGIRNHRTEIVNNVLAPHTTVVWIGLNDRYAEGQWVWGDGVLATHNLPWVVGEPNNKDNEDCSNIAYIFKWKMNDVGCTNAYSFVCEKVI